MHVPWQRGEAFCGKRHLQMKPLDTPGPIHYIQADLNIPENQRNVNETLCLESFEEKLQTND